MLKHNESAWEFELNGSFRACFNLKKHIGPLNNSVAVFPYDFNGWSLCMKGKYFDEALEFFSSKEKLSFDTTKRGICSKSDFTHKPRNIVYRLLKYGIKAMLSFLKSKPKIQK